MTTSKEASMTHSGKPDRPGAPLQGRFERSRPSAAVLCPQQLEASKVLTIDNTCWCDNHASLKTMAAMRPLPAQMHSYPAAAAC